MGSEERAARRVVKRAEKVERKADRTAARETRKAARVAKKADGAELGRTRGTQFWADRLVVDGWRIQEHVQFGRVRVVSGDNVRVHTGTSYEEAHAAFTEAIGTPQRKGSHLVVFLHGYGGKSQRMAELCASAREAGFVADAIEYPSLFRRVDEIADNVVQLIVDSAAFRGRQVKTVSVVAFSMGGLVASTIIARLAAREDAPRVGRLVTIGTPHRGSPLADLTKVFTVVGGPNITELTTLNQTQLGRLKKLKVSFGVVGGRGHRNGWTFIGLVDDGDGIVEIESAIAPEADDSLVIDRVKHTKLPSNPEVIAGVIRFLGTGRFA